MFCRDSSAALASESSPKGSRLAMPEGDAVEVGHSSYSSQGKLMSEHTSL